MKIVADDKIPYIRGVFEPYADITYLPGKAITAKEVKEADALLVRTRTRCDAALLAGSSVRMVATATIGTDHIDLPWCAIVFDIGASTGGTDIVALILAKYTSMEIGKALMVSDILIVLAAAWRFGMGTGLYCILGLIGKSFVVDGAIENIRLRKVCTIVTSNPQPILDFIIHNMNRSATVEKAYGAYTHHELSVLVTVLTRRQALQLRNFLRENDPRSFITIVNSSEIIGKGFRSVE